MPSVVDVTQCVFFIFFSCKIFAVWTKSQPICSEVLHLRLNRALPGNILHCVVGIEAGEACTCCSQATAACFCIILYSINRSPHFFLRKQTAILLPLWLGVAHLTPGKKKKNGFECRVWKQSSVKSFVCSLYYYFFKKYLTFFSRPLVLVATRPYFCECSVRGVLFIDVCWHITAARSFTHPSAVVSWPSRDAACEWHRLDHTHGRRSKSASLHPLFGIR